MEKIYLDFVKENLNEWYGNELSSSIFLFFNTERKSSLRINLLKSNKEEVYKELSSRNIKFELVEGIDDAIIFEQGEESKISALAIYQNGEIYMQSLSSMLPPIVLNPQSDAHILDMCAAPGSKTSQLAAMTNNNACILACELNQIRAERLKFNLEKLGVKRTTVLLQDARNLDEYYRFNKIMLDAPCSGSGTILLSDNSKQKFNSDLLMKCKKRQIALLKKGLSLLNKNGELIYSTCSIFKDENEEVIKACLGKDYEIVPINVSNVKYLELLPSTIEGVITVKPNEYFEGFFIAKIRKK